MATREDIAESRAAIEALGPPRWRRLVATLFAAAIAIGFLVPLPVFAR